MLCLGTWYGLQLVGLLLWAGGGGVLTGAAVSTYFQNVTFYVSATPDWTTGILCQANVSAPASVAKPTVVMCPSSLAATRFVTLLRFVPSGATDKYMTVSELKPLRYGARACDCSQPVWPLRE